MKAPTVQTARGDRVHPIGCEFKPLIALILFGHSEFLYRARRNGVNQYTFRMLFIASQFKEMNALGALFNAEMPAVMHSIPGRVG